MSDRGRSTSPGGHHHHRSPPRVRRLLHKAVMQLVSDADRLQKAIRQATLQESDQILRAVFGVDEQSGMPVLRRVGPLSLHELDARYAVTLAHLLDTATMTQFVAWVSLEPEDPDAADTRGDTDDGLVDRAVHTCAVIDAHNDRPVWEGPLHDPSQRRSRSRDLFAEMSHAGSPVGRLGEGHGFSSGGEEAEHRSGAGGAGEERLLGAARRGAYHPNGVAAQGSGSDTDVAGGRPTSPGRRAAATGASPLTAEQQGTLDDILSVTMLCSRATAKIMTSVLEAHARLDKLYDLTAPMASGPTTAQATKELGGKLDRLEGRLAAMGEHVSAMEDRQGSIYEEVLTRTAQRREVAEQASHPQSTDRWVQTEAFDVVRPEQLRGTVGPRRSPVKRASAPPERAADRLSPKHGATSSPPRAASPPKSAAPSPKAAYPSPPKPSLAPSPVGKKLPLARPAASTPKEAPGPSAQNSTTGYPAPPPARGDRDGVATAAPTQQQGTTGGALQAPPAAAQQDADAAIRKRTWGSATTATARHSTNDDDDGHGTTTALPRPQSNDATAAHALQVPTGRVVGHLADATLKEHHDRRAQGHADPAHRAPSMLQYEAPVQEYIGQHELVDDGYPMPAPAGGGGYFDDAQYGQSPAPQPPSRAPVTWALEASPPAPAEERYLRASSSSSPPQQQQQQRRYAEMRFEGPPIGAGTGSPVYRQAGNATAQPTQTQHATALGHPYQQRGHRVPTMNQPQPQPGHAGSPGRYHTAHVAGYAQYQ